MTEEEEKSLLTPWNQVNCYHKSANGHVVSYEVQYQDEEKEGEEERAEEKRRMNDSREKQKLYLKNDAFPT